MQVPKMLCGKHKEVVKRCSPCVRAVKQGASFDDVDFGEMVTMETGDVDVVTEGVRTGVTERFLLLDRGRRGERDEEVHFRVYVLPQAPLEIWAQSHFSDPVFDRFFDWCLQETWRVTGLLGECGSLYLLRRPEAAEPFLREVLARWAELVEVGPRYARGLLHGKLWSTMTTIQSALLRFGIAEEELLQYPRNLDDLIRRVLEAKPSD